MPKVALYNTKGEQVGEVELSDDVFGVEVRPDVMHRVVVNYLANQRQGTSSTLTRGEVSGGGRKPWRQKGTGRARHGSIRSPLWRKGGIVFGPKPRSYRFTLPKKLKRYALKSALSAKVADNELIMLDSLTMDAPKTKSMAEILKNIKADKKALIVLPGKDENVEKSARNLPGVKTTSVNTLNVYDILNHDNLIITKEAAERVEEVYAG
ncbi:MAG: large subunit ribosomal protein [Thermoanaerobacteraceae bacterium]|jgi:large subunit ribosomal protein L4|uniref:Large ribosomal subunit protein uL4 n=1 Tax=Biomaibacter acetigenes TaxID=2316383 RepID=A0A3G2R396_9FIRM|nr:50S ribosomal protein L4 [Biomaibacter acetigenes]MDK2878577.1 large subunit ribosomal protein [Thermoanaerobacteraceae bacterium]RKL61685.1 50S ribosomal protein L4 [Thermoanaerobacteraceae bacterium SP2]AYO29417.1 50S ribosomal protein L4 [Biomaibacter acetigenes]MDN5302088.1 large subunit ribosomal protein [Thermoanaerobacteraceae bacterium]MDN5311835.1 large subunit ribosomal protein [Thermoanaerobacteraceae bacterium]